MLRNVLILVVLLSFFNCKEKESQISKTESAEDIIKESIEVAGGDLYDRSDINFDFRDIHYRAIRNHGRFQLERHFKDSLSEIKDVLSNSGFERFRDEEKVHLSDSLTSLYSNSVNSVHYFSVLPYGLDGKAVHKNYLGSKEIKGKDYHKIKITFSEDGGGEDFEDEFYLSQAYETLGKALAGNHNYQEAYLAFAEYDNLKKRIFTAEADQRYRYAKRQIFQRPWR